MDKQIERIILRVDPELKAEFKKVCDEQHMTISGRIKHLMKMDVINIIKKIGRFM